MVKWLATAILSGVLAVGMFGCDKPADGKKDKEKVEKKDEKKTDEKKTDETKKEDKKEEAK